ncbi:MAG: hypothetical protein DRP94_04105 [Candidatus Latescibacterota bacterium]|nr:MAG: hypothetical protein DRP94_04105 [Candidatus Latescibacterota bacterium]RKY67387.1 MAG: hypothetical protein DRQ08_00070 [Candidatus Latescibacterota bacterium]RKY74126.1 MAG: hypothetical protein DRQ14_02830 [Candidatus Latescibacterota bacterium]
MRFVADDMLGRLAKWLRLLGYDVIYPAPARDAQLLRLAQAEDRVLLTRDRGLAERCSGRKVLVESGDPWEQLSQVVRELDLDVEKGFLTRCALCNEPIESLPKEEVRDLVPPYVFGTHERFARCPKCGRVYWEGSHVERMRRKLKEALGWKEGT